PGCHVGEARGGGGRPVHPHGAQAPRGGKEEEQESRLACGGEPLLPAINGIRRRCAPERRQGEQHRKAHDTGGRERLLDVCRGGENRVPGHCRGGLILPDIFQMKGGGYPCGGCVVPFDLSPEAPSLPSWASSGRRARRRGARRRLVPPDGGRQSSGGRTSALDRERQEAGAGQHRATAGGRSVAIRSRSRRNSSRGTATSAIWKTR